MGCLCSCLHVDGTEENDANGNTSLLHKFLNKCAALFSKQEMHATSSSIQGEAGPVTTTTTAEFVNENTQSDTNNRSVPMAVTSDAADSRPSNLQQSGHISRHDEKDKDYLNGSSEPPRKKARSHKERESVNGADCEGESEECQSGCLGKIFSAKGENRMGSVHSTSEDEDVCPTCLEEYTTENPKITTHCNHHFHLGCIYEWMERSQTCPLCGKMMMFDERS